MATSARLEELKQKFNENPRRYFAPLANEHRKLGDLEQAITLCRTHLPQQPQHVSGHIVLAQALFEAGNTTDARQAFEVALDLDPENLIALRFLGDIARGQGDHLTARHWYERVLDADPRNDEIARLIREIDNGAAAPAAVTERIAEPAAETPSVEAELAVPNADEPNEVTVAAVEPLSTAAAPESIEDLATAWQHEAAALDASATTSEVSEPAEEPEPAPVAMDDTAPTPEPELEVVAQAEEPIAANVADEEPSAQPSESWAEPDEYFVANVPTVESSTIPAPSPFTEIDYSLFEAVADEEPVALPNPTFTPAQPPSEPTIAAPSTAEEAVEQPTAAGDDWFAAPSEREPEAPSVEVTSETAFDLDAAFQSVLPNKQETEDETIAEQPDELPELADVPHSREWEAPESSAAPAPPVAAEAEVTTSLEASFESTDGVDDAFAELDRMTASIEADIAGIEADIAGHAMLLPDDEYTAAEAVASPPATPQHVDALIGRTPDSDIPAIEETPSAFVTETMAELYLQQGFREEAIAVYRQLLAMNPDDAVLAGRVRALEGGAAERDEGPLPSEEAARRDAYRLTPAAHADAVGQSMRAFLGVFARRRAPMRRREVVTNDVAAVPPPEPAQRESALSALFGAPPGADDGAAAVLAGAFAPPNAETEPLPGRPTRAAAQELSLGDVFAGSVATSGARAATFDEFFSTGNAEQSARSPLDEEGSDMEQFTAWLEGLKKK